MPRLRHILWRMAVSVSFSTLSFGAPMLGQVDTFTGSAQGWTNGSRAPDPTVVPTGGPGGIADSYLRITGNGDGPGGKITAFNVSQWAGDYFSSGIGAISMDLLNLGTVPLSIRIGLRSSFGLGSSGFSSTTPYTLAADGTWHQATFLLDAASLTRINSTTLSLDALLSHVGELRILDSNTPSLTGTPITSQLGVDNVRAEAVQAVPEPSSLLLIAPALALCIGASRRALRRTLYS